MSPKAKLSGKDLILLLLYSPGATGTAMEPIRGRTRLMKMIFLFKEEVYPYFSFDRSMDENKLPEFYAWSYGPFSRDVYSDLDFFLHTGFVEASTAGADDTTAAEAAELSHWEAEMELDEVVVSDYTEESLRLTKLGQTYVEERLWGRLSAKQREALAGFKQRMCTAPLSAILRYVYMKYDSFTSKSVIKGQVLS